jgi:high affinity sulfate transporter 1
MLRRRMAPDRQPSALSRLVPSLAWLRSYRGEWWRADLVAGLTAAAVVIPKAMAYATIAGLPVQVGLYTAFVPMVIYALLGTSAPLSVSTTTTIAILSGAALGLAAPGGSTPELITAAVTLTALVGAMLAAAAVLRLGFVANFISEPVLTGFKSGIAVVIVVDQIPKLLGIHFEKTGFFRNLLAIVEHVPETSLATLLVAVAMFALIVSLERWAPRAPAPLVAVAIGIAASAVLGLGGAGVETVGAVPRGLPAPVLPQLALVELLWPAAAGIALMSFTETIAAGRAFAAPDELRPAPNQELFALGLANLGGGLFGAMPAGGGTSQTAVNRRAGGRTQVAGLVTAAMSLATLLLLAPVIAFMPQATLAAVVVAYSIELFQPAEFRAIRRVRNLEFRWALVAFAGVVLAGTLRGILLAVVVSLLALAQQTNNPPLYEVVRKRGTNVFRRRSAEHPDDETFPGLLIVRPEGRIYFANAQRIGDQFWPLAEKARPRVVLFDCSALTDLEYTALKMLGEAEQRAQRDGITLWLAALNPDVLAMLQRSPLGERLGRERLFFNLEAAVAKYQALGAGAGPA